MLQHRRVASIFLVLLVIGTAVPGAAAASDSTLEQIEDMFMPEGEELQGPQHLLFIVLSFLLVFALLFYALKDIFDNTPEATVVALTISLFIIPSGGYHFISELLMAIFGLGAEGLPSSPDGGGTIPGVNLEDISAVERGVVTLIVAGVMTVIMKTMGNNEIDTPEMIVIGSFSIATWLFLGGAEIMFVMVGLVAILSIGVGMMQVLKHQGGLFSGIIAITGLMVVGYGLSAYKNALPPGLQPLGEMGNLILQGVGWVAGLIIFAVLVGLFLFFHLTS